MTTLFLINGLTASPLSFSPAPPVAFFVHVFELKSGNWLATVPSPSAAAIPLSSLQLASNQTYKSVFRLVQQFCPIFARAVRPALTFCRFQLSAVLSSTSPFPSNSTFSANSSLSTVVYLDGLPVTQSHADNLWTLTSTQFSHLVLHIELSGVLASLSFSITTGVDTSVLPVRAALALFHSSCFTREQVISSGILFSTLSKSRAYRNVTLSQPFLPVTCTPVLSNVPSRSLRLSHLPRLLGESIMFGAAALAFWAQAWCSPCRSRGSFPHVHPPSCAFGFPHLRTLILFPSAST
jgi:hypothetical protein